MSGHLYSSQFHLVMCASSFQLPEALETSIRVMLPGETALVTSSPAHAYDAFPRYACA